MNLSNISSEDAKRIVNDKSIPWLRIAYDLEFPNSIISICNPPSILFNQFAKFEITLSKFIDELEKFSKSNPLIGYLKYLNNPIWTLYPIKELFTEISYTQFIKDLSKKKRGSMRQMFETGPTSKEFYDYLDLYISKELSEEFKNILFKKLNLRRDETYLLLDSSVPNIVFIYGNKEEIEKKLNERNISEYILKNIDNIERVSYAKYFNA